MRHYFGKKKKKKKGGWCFVKCGLGKVNEGDEGTQQPLIIHFAAQKESKNPHNTVHKIGTYDIFMRAPFLSAFGGRPNWFGVVPLDAPGGGGMRSSPKLEEAGESRGS